MRQFVEQNVVEERFPIEMNQLLLVHQRLRDGGENLGELVGNLVLQHHFLGSLLLPDPLVIGKVEGQGLHRLPGVARGVDQVNHPDWTLRPSISLHVVFDRKILLHVRKVGFKLDKIRGLDWIGDGNKCLVGCLEAEESVLIGLVGSDGDLDLGVQVHPVLVRLVIVVSDEGGGPGPEERLQAGVVGENGGGQHLVVGGMEILLEEGAVVLSSEITTII